jgi:protein-S-isoprenylcysteine O-methyltransferase Ste14
MAGKAASTIGSAIFFVLAPGTVAGLVPYMISGWRAGPPFLGIPAGRFAGGLLVAIGVLALLHCFARFALEGRGTPAPAAPTEVLVVSGLYRYVRNPMYVAVVCIIVGQAVLFGSAPLLGYGAIVWLSFHAFVLAYEEPTLRRRYGNAYDVYRANVPRWVPRISPFRVTFD